MTEDVENETQAHWYLRQLLGSANITGGPLFHIMSGNLSHQIEQHLFPDMPSNRYAEAAQEVQAICEKYALPYNAKPFRTQLSSVLKKVLRYRATHTGHNCLARLVPLLRSGYRS